MSIRMCVTNYKHLSSSRAAVPSTHARVMLTHQNVFITIVVTKHFLSNRFMYIFAFSIYSTSAHCHYSFAVIDIVKIA